MYEGPGIYRHYKGGHYRAWGLARHETLGQVMVIYSSYDLDHERSRWMSGVDFVARPLGAADGPDSWNVDARVGGPEDETVEYVPRFTRVK